MTTCEFFYVSRATNLPIKAVGTKTTWLELQQEFNRKSEAYPDAEYFRTISEKGPKLFAVVNRKWVLYHENEEWHRYISACDVKYRTSPEQNIVPQVRNKADPNEGWLWVNSIDGQIQLLSESGEH